MNRLGIPLRRMWLLAAAAIFCAGGCGRQEECAPSPMLPPESEPESVRRMLLPTAGDLLAAGEAAEVFMPTASGRPESALYGSVRTRQAGSRFRPSFHEGVDIAPRERDRRGRALDVVRAVAAGRVAYLNRSSGRSNYGQYAVLLHPSTAGEIYTLYAHLATIAPGLAAGQPVLAGQPLGVLGHTSSVGLPAARAHLHFEVGLLANAHFDRWYRAQKLRPDHGRYHGYNLVGLDPLAFYRRQREASDFTVAGFLAQIPPAFELLLATPQPWDFFQRYPGLWQGPAYDGRAMFLAVSEGGLPLCGRNATAEERAALGRRRAAVLRVDASVLGRNGLRLVVRRNGNWELVTAGERWLDMLSFH